MKNRIKGLLATLFIFCAGGSLFASDSHIYDLSGIAPIWDISGTYSEDLDGLSLDLVFVQDGKGKIGGGGSVSSFEDGLNISADMVVKGSLKQSKGVATVKMTVKYKGIVTDGTQSIKFSASQKINAEIDSELLQMTGTMSTSMSMAGYKFSETEYWEEDLPAGMDGACTLELNPVTTAKGISGEGTISLSNLETVNFDLKGKEKNGIVKLKLKGSKASGDSGASLSVEIEGYSGVLESIKGKVMGQGMQWVSVPEPYFSGGSASISVIGYYPPDPFEPTPWY